jgi:hypothetical protein
MSKKIIKIFLLEDFFHLPPVSTTLMVYLELKMSLRIFEKFEATLIIYCTQGLGGMIHEKYLKSKISWHCPFKTANIEPYFRGNAGS